MDWKPRIAAALSAAPEHAPDAEVLEELAQHARAMYEAARAEGLSDVEAYAHVDVQIERWRLDAARLRHRTRRPAAIDPPPAAASLPLAGRAQGVGGTLTDLARIQDHVRSARVSSWDRSGGNHDRLENIPSGQRRTIFEVKGAGVINHLWVTIAPPPEQLSRNDIILRMYWDGETEPSVESPIGPFFGQGSGKRRCSRDTLVAGSSHSMV